MARAYLKLIDLTTIANKRINECNRVDIFYTLFIRALMHTSGHIIIIRPMFLLKNSKDIKLILNTLMQLSHYHTQENPDNMIANRHLNILLLDSQINQQYYEESPCHIIK